MYVFLYNSQEIVKILLITPSIRKYGTHLKFIFVGIYDVLF